MQATKNLKEALNTARNAEKLGFNDDETGICVYHLEIGMQYKKMELEIPKNSSWSFDSPVVFRRYKMNGEWREEWFNEMMKLMMGLH